MNYNKIILAGHLTRDPEMTYLPSQTPVTEIGLATNRKYKDKNGQQKEEVCYVDCRAYGAAAETLKKYLTKGNPLLIEGRLCLDTWQAQDGSKRSRHRIFIESFQFLGDNYRSSSDIPEDTPNAPATNDDLIPF